MIEYPDKGQGQGHSCSLMTSVIYYCTMYMTASCTEIRVLQYEKM